MHNSNFILSMSTPLTQVLETNAPGSRPEPPGAPSTHKSGRGTTFTQDSILGGKGRSQQPTVILYVTDTECGHKLEPSLVKYRKIIYSSLLQVNRGREITSMQNSQYI